MAATATVTGDWQVHLVTDDTGPGVWWRRTYSTADVQVATTADAYDRWAPLNTDLDYYWQGSGGPQLAARVRVESTHPVLSSTLYSGSLQVVVMDQAPLRWEAASVVHTVLGRPDPVVAVAPMRHPSGTLRLHAADRSRRLELLSLLRAGDPLILRAPCPDAVDDMTLQPLEVTDPLVSASDKSGARWIDIEYRAVTDAPTYWNVPPTWSWGDLEDTYATWGDVEEAFATWGDVETGP